MEFNPSKCVVIHITRSRTPVPSQYLLHGQVLESVAGSKYLGVEISSNLSFNGHIQNITTSASRSLGFLKRNIRSKNPELREIAYKTVVRPFVEYSSSVWSPYTKSNIARLEMVQRRAARWTLSEYYPYASVTQMLQSLGWRSLEQRRSDSRLCLFYKIILCSCSHASICCTPIENSQEFTHPWLPSNSIHCRLLQILILSPLNRAMEPAASTHSTSAHL